MNSMELVRFSATGARPLQHLSQPSQPAFYPELAAPIRSAILRGRQHLATEQRSDGSWVGHQLGDATLASHLIFWLIFRERGESELAAQAAATIRDGQLPEGGWTSAPGGRPDLNTSVRAYFALKLSGLAANDDCLQRARRVIRGLGGADATDFTTRFLLALFGQIDYDVCPAVRPELFRYANRHHRNLFASLAALWSHRPVCPIDIDLGVRELFLKPPADWKPVRAIEYEPGPFVHFRRLAGRIGRSLERLGWTPFRNRGIDRIGTFLQHQAQSADVADLDFCTLGWGLFALTTIGYSADSPQMRHLEAQFFEMVRVDQETDVAIPSRRMTPQSDTIASLHALLMSGIAREHSAIAAAVAWIRNSRRRPAGLPATGDVCQLIQLFSQWADDRRDENLPPPRIRISTDQKLGPRRSQLFTAARHRGIAPIVKSLVEGLLVSQRRDGGWVATTDGRDGSDISTAEITGEVLIALKDVGGAQVQRAKELARAYLRARQQADGHWRDPSQRNSVRATAAAVRGLIATGAAPDDDAVAAGINWLLAYQNADGGWCDTTDIENAAAAVSPTALVLEALVAVGREHDPAARGAAAFLLQSQNDDGGWSGGEFDCCDGITGVWYRHELQSTCLALTALSRWLVAAASTQSEAAPQMSLRIVGTAADPS
jgi:squalene-hopene/tetraprenyl-beta-curcumene cyclase